MPSRRKMTPYSRPRRNHMRMERDALNLEYLRVVRNVAKAEIVESGYALEPLSVYSSNYFPLRFQFREKTISDGNIKASYLRYPMPEWKDLTIKGKLDIFCLYCEEWDNSLYTFNPKIHPDLIDSLKAAAVVRELGRRTQRRLRKLGNLPRRHFFIVEARNKVGAPVSPHIHGMAMVEDDRQAKAVKDAMGRAAGQEEKGRGKLPSGNLGRFHYYEEGKSWTGYITKNLANGRSDFGRQAYVFSREANQISRAFYEFITGKSEV